MPQSKSKPPKKKSKSIRKREYYTLPAKAHTSNKVPASVDKDEKRSGVFSQMAATAGGVAVGTTVGHFVGNILTSIIGLVHAARNGVDQLILQSLIFQLFKKIQSGIYIKMGRVQLEILKLFSNIQGMASNKTTDSNKDIQRYEEPRRTCSKEIQQFINCAATEKDITLCQGFNEAIQHCKQKHNLS